MEPKQSENQRTRCNRVRSPERLAYWYLRLNGFLLLENFVIHSDAGSNQRTDADLFGVRFANRSENPLRPMTDDPKVAECSTLCNVVIAEVKTGVCALNGPWTRPEDENMQRALHALGCFPEAAVNMASRELYEKGRFATAHATCRLLAFGDRKGQLTIPEVPQIMFDDMLRFIHGRFNAYRAQKSSVGNWAKDGQELKELADRHRELEGFVSSARSHFGLGGIP